MELESTAGAKELRSMWEFASIYSFFNEFRDHLELTGFSIEDLEQAIQVNPKDSPLMQDIWIKLLLQISRKKASLINPDTWEATLRTAINQHQSAYWLTNPLKICEYKRLPLRKRVFILKSVVDWVLEDSEMLQRHIDRQKTEKMRYTPLGTDANGSVYWYLNDYRLYKETAVSDEEAQKRREERRLKERQDREVMKRAADDKRKREEDKRMLNVKVKPREFYVPIEEVKVEATKDISSGQPIDSNDLNQNINGTETRDNNTNVSGNNDSMEVSHASNNNNNTNNNEEKGAQVDKTAEVKAEQEKEVKDEDKNDESEQVKQPHNEDEADVGITYEDEQVAEESDEMTDTDLHAWELVCRNTTEWGHFVSQFKQSKHSGEREIAAFIEANIIEHISTKMQAYLHAKRRTSLLPIQHRKKSTRLQMKEIQKIEQRVTRSGGRRKGKEVKESREDRLEARRQRRDVTLAKALMSPSSEDETSTVTFDENGNPIEVPKEEQAPVVEKPPRPKLPPKPKQPRKSLAEELLELEQEEGPLDDDDESEDDDDWGGGEAPRRRASTGGADAARGRGPRQSLSPNSGRPRGPRPKSTFETELIPTTGPTFVSSRGRQVKTRMWSDQDTDDFDERVTFAPVSRAKQQRKQPQPRVNPDPTLNLKFKLQLIKDELGEEGYAKATTPKPKVGRPPKSATKKQQEEFMPPSEDEEEFEAEDEEEDYEDEDDDDFDVGKRRKSGGSAGRPARRSSASNHGAQPVFNTNTSINANINSNRGQLTSSLDTMQSNISNLISNITATPSVGAYKPPLIFGNTASPADINWNYVAPKTTAPVTNAYNTAQMPLVTESNERKRTSGQMDPSGAAGYAAPVEGQPVLKRQRLDEAELLMGLLPIGAAAPSTLNPVTAPQHPSMAQFSNHAPVMAPTYVQMPPMNYIPQQQPMYQQNPFADVTMPMFSTPSVMNTPIMATNNANLNNSQSINLYTSDELPPSTQNSQLASSQDIDQFLNMDNDSK